MKRRCAYVMDRNMFGPIRGEWDGDWRGWWGPEPPYHAPVFVLTNYPHDAIEMEGGTTFYFVTNGFEAALERAKVAASADEVDIAGGASTVRQAFAAGAIDELVLDMLDIVPVLLGAGERLFDGVEDPGLDPVEVIHSPHATHMRYRVGRWTWPRQSSAVRAERGRGRRVWRCPPHDTGGSSQAGVSRGLRRAGGRPDFA